MYLALAGAAAGALDLLSSLTAGKSGTGKATTGLTQNTAAFGLSGTTASAASSSSPCGTCGQSGALSPRTLNALLAAQDSSQASAPASTSQSNALKNLFAKLDSNGDGQIGKSEFESNLGAGGTNTANAASVFGRLDTNGDGSVGIDELSAALKGSGSGRGPRHAHGAGGAKSGQDALLQALDGASSTSVSNSDGSISTTLTYSDGSTATLNSPSAKRAVTASSSASTSYNLVEKLIQKQVDALALSAKQSLSVSV